MALCPFAVHRLLPENATQQRITPRAIILHSAAGRGSLRDWFDNDGVTLESHFWVSDDGVIEQYMDTTVRADANRNANGFAISIESESSRDATERWTPEAAAAIIRLCDWLCDTHKIPRVQCPRWDGSGIGWHTMWGSPSQWTPVAKSCPGVRRIPQARDEIIPAVARMGTGQPSEEDDMTPEQYQLLKDVDGKLDRLLTDAKNKTGTLGVISRALTKLQGIAQSDYEAQLIDIAEQREEV